MAVPRRAFKIGSLVWSILMSVGVIALVGSILLPSTKRSHFDFNKERERAAAEAAALAAAEAEATTGPTTEPTSGPSTQP